MKLSFIKIVVTAIVFTVFFVPILPVGSFWAFSPSQIERFLTFPLLIVIYFLHQPLLQLLSSVRVFPVVERSTLLLAFCRTKCYLYRMNIAM